MLFVFSGLTSSAQSNPPPAPSVTYYRSYVNDIPNQPLVKVEVSGATNVACFTIEEDLPSPAFPVDISNGGVWVPSLNAIRWGPFFNITSNSVSYRLTGLPATYPVNGGSWMDGQWFFSPGVSMITVLPVTGGGVPAAPPQVATPVFSPPSGASVPTNVTIACTTTNAVIYYSLDGSLPTTSSVLYTGAVYVASASTLRAVAFTNGWTPSVAALAYYGPPATTANAVLTRTITANPSAAPVATLNVQPGSNATCVAVTEALPFGLGATNITAGGSYLASNNVVQWGPFFGTNALILSYQAVGVAGTYPVQASWSVDGISASEAQATNLVITSTNSAITSPPLQVAAPTFSPASGSTVPVAVTLACATPGTTIYYTLDGSLPTPSSALYSAPISLTNASTVRAVAFTNGWTPSVSAVAYYGPPAVPANAQLTSEVTTNGSGTPQVVLALVPGTNASCVAVTETLPLGLSATSISSGGSYVASNNVVEWGPFFGNNAVNLSFLAVGPPGSYPVQATWSVDGISSSAAATTLVVTSTNGNGGVPTAPPQEPVPALSPALSANLPVTVSIIPSDAQGQTYYTTDGTLPTPASPPYTTPLTFTSQTTLRAVEYRAGYTPSGSAVGNYVPVLNTNFLTLVRNVTGDGTFLPSIALTATPSPGVNCYAVAETIPPGLIPDGLGTNAVWIPATSTIQWGPFLDNAPRTLTYQVFGPSGTYPLSGAGSFNGYSATVTGPANLTINDASSGTPNTNFPACSSEPLVYDVMINPAPGLISVNTASGTVNWGDGTSSAITQPDMTFSKQYTTSGTYTINITANWTGNTSDMFVAGQATKTDTVQVVNQCAPVIVAEPTNLVVLAGTTAQFSVNATSVFPLSYQWYYEANPIVSPDTFATLTLPDVTPLADGNYSVVVSSTYGSVTSTPPATLTVINPQISSVQRNADGSVTLASITLPNSASRVWATTNLALPQAWQVVSTNVADTNGLWQLIDTNASGLPMRYYRFSTP